MNDDIVYFSYIELICIELYIMINMMVCNDDGLNNDHTIDPTPMYFLQFQMVLHSKDSILIFLTGIRLIIHFIFEIYRIFESEKN